MKLIYPCQNIIGAINLTNILIFQFDIDKVHIPRDLYFVDYVPRDILNINMFLLYFPYKNKLIFSFFRMSGTYQDYALEATNPPFVSNEPLNGTKIEQSILEPNETNLEELENYDVASYLESLLGPQRQPVEKVCHIF